jgi:hypothetical protein
MKIVMILSTFSIVPLSIYHFPFSIFRKQEEHILKSTFMKMNIKLAFDVIPKAAYLAFLASLPGDLQSKRASMISCGGRIFLQHRNVWFDYLKINQIIITYYYAPKLKE